MNFTSQKNDSVLTPVTLLSGYLGSGKTTLVNYVLNNADGLRIAVMVNDFGDLPIDTSLIVAKDDDIIQLSGGCVCCSYGNDLVRALARLQDLPNKPEHVLIECSGVALPTPVKMSLSLIQGLAYDGTVGLIDGSQILKQLSDRYIGDTVARQIKQADVLFLSKIDKLTDDVKQSVYEKIGTITSKHAVGIEYGSVPLDTVLSSYVADDLSVDKDMKFQNSKFTHANFESMVVRHANAVNLTTLHSKLTSHSAGIVRAKGYLYADDGRQYLMQLVGDHCEFTPVNKIPISGLSENESAFVVIGIKGKLLMPSLS